MMIKTIVISLLLLTNLSQAATIPEVIVSKPDKWIEKITFDESNIKNISELSDGKYYLLVDQQTNARKEKQQYKHYVIKLLNENAVEDSSRISITFSPEFQKVDIHKVIIWRDGKPIKQEVKSKIKLLQREKELENLIYDGRWTATLIMDDVRKGDTLEYSYTVTGQNPAYEDNVTELIYLQWTVPVRKQIYRLLWPNSKAITLTAKKHIKSSTKIKTFNNYKEYRIERENYKTVQIDSQTPSWFDPWDWIGFSNISNWKEVVDWGRKFYKVNENKNKDITKLVNSIRASNISKIDQASAALRYVQDEIRYLGIEVGSGSYIPSKTNVTLKRRYGDCKDKTYLLLDILNELDIEAYPVLANTDYGKVLGEYGASLDAFNHVFVNTIIDGENHWLETTTNNQAGNLNQLYQPDYGQVLILKPGNTKLTTMKVDNDYHTTVIYETFDLTKGINKEALYTVKTISSGSIAEKFRRNVNSKGLKKIAKEYLDYYINYYSSIKPIVDISVSDNKQKNKVITVEKYSITEMWEDNKERKKHYAYFYNNAIDSYIKKPKIKKRNSPFKYSQLVDVEQNITVLLPDGWSIKNDDFKYKTAFFDFSQKIIFNEKINSLLLKYKFKTLKKHIEVNEIDDYIKSVKKLKENVDYHIYSSYKVNEVVSSYKISDFFSSTVIAIIIVLIFVLGLIYSYIEFKLDQKHRPMTEEVKYYPVALEKVFILSLLTYGLYLIYWFYKNWYYVKNRDGSTIIPTARAIFHTLWFYPLYNSFSRDEAFSEGTISEKLKYIFLTIVFFISAFVMNSEHVISFIAMVISSLCIIPFVHKINGLTSTENIVFKYNSKWRPRHFILIVLFSSMALFDIAGRIHLIPGDVAVKGSSLWTKDIKMMHRIGVFSPEDKLLMFYSDSVFDYKNDGNGLTNNGVFSYWRDEATNELSKEVAKYKDISDIKNTSDGDSIKIIRKDGTEFYMYTKDSKDLKFYITIKANLAENKEIKK